MRQKFSKNTFELGLCWPSIILGMGSAFSVIYIPGESGHQLQPASWLVMRTGVYNPFHLVPVHAATVVMSSYMHLSSCPLGSVRQFP